jgi:tetratricopeptide (TPR) repeat protein
LPLPRLLEALRADQARRWRAGQRLLAEAYLDAFPQLAGSAEDALVLIWGEALLRFEIGEAPQPAEYRDRFPRHADALAAQFALQSQLDKLPDARTLAPDQSPGATGPPRPRVPGYEILEELGRGGMGVVYQARHIQLSRLVALKMVLAGSRAGEPELRRFRAEAEAVARLQHPHIVQIFEVGEHDGLPYLALEHCAGGSLAAQLDGTPLRPDQAATLVETLARAAQAAHEAGVVHRDLKPANILRGADGTPKIADFGLAKRLDAQTAATQTGAIVGTPSYMAPEQAGGKTREVGPAVDVWALGAVLYECLTGRPAFLGPTPTDTLLRVVSDEPVPPRKLNPAVPRDLETICLKCLRKEPQRRYASAEALAEDLRRFRGGEAIQARAVGRVGRLWRWCRRKPLVAALSAALIVSLLAGAGVSVYLLRAMPAPPEPDADFALARGRIHLQRKEYQRALEVFSEVIQADPRHAIAHAERANAHMGLGQPDQAMADCITAMRLDPKLVKLFVQWAVPWINNGYYQYAVVSCTAVLQVNGRSAEAYHVRSHAHAMLRQWDRAADDYARAMELLPRGSYPKNNVPFMEGCRLVGKGDQEGYRQHCARLFADRSDAGQPSSTYLLARLCVLAPDSGIDPAEAIRLCEQVAQKERTPWYLHTLGLAHYRAGQYDRAISRLQESAVNWRAASVSWLVLAMAHHRLGQTTLARRWLDQAVRQPVPYVASPDAVSWPGSEAMAYQLLRREAEALVRGTPKRPRK